MIPTGTINGFPTTGFPGLFNNPFNGVNPGFNPINSFPGFNGFNPGWNTTPFGLTGNGFNGAYTGGFNGGFNGGFTGGSPMNWSSLAGWNGTPVNTVPFNGFNPGFQGIPFGSFPSPFGAYPGFNPGVCPTGYPSNGYTNTTGVNTTTGFGSTNPYSPFTGNTGIGANCAHAA